MVVVDWWLWRLWSGGFGGGGGLVASAVVKTGGFGELLKRHMHITQGHKAQCDTMKSSPPSVVASFAVGSCFRASPLTHLPPPQSADRTPPASTVRASPSALVPWLCRCPLQLTALVLCQSQLRRGLEGMEDDVGKDVGREVEEVEGDCEPYKKKQRKKSSVILAGNDSVVT
nr:hypothetical protein Iba_chr10fCG8490 [Ipomoea batatas]